MRIKVYCANVFALLIGVLMVCGVIAVHAQDAPEGYIYEWSTLIVQLEDELDEAAEEDKDLEALAVAEEIDDAPDHFFVYFAGSDWCPHCMRFEEEVILTPTFQRYVEANFIPVLIDSPRYYTLSENQARYNQLQLEKYEITGFPTVAIISVDNELVQKIGYGGEGVHRFIRTLKNITKPSE